MKRNFFLFLIVFSGIFLSENFYAQLSKKHFIPPLTNAEFGNANPENQFLYISTPSNQNISFTVKPIGATAANFITGVVSKNNPVEIFVGNGVSQLFAASQQTSVVTNNKGYIIEADDAVYVSVRMLAGNSAQAGALVSKGLSALGNTFRVGSFTNENPGTNYLNFVSVMASENNTTVTFDDLPAGISIKNYTGTLPITITLNEGESYIVATNSSENTINRDGLIGTLVQSDKPIVVNCGSANGSFHNGGGRDYGIDQIVDLSKVGSEYIFVRGDGDDGWENVLIVAHSDGTTIRVNGNTNLSASINAGEYYLIEGANYNSNGNLYVETSNAVFAYQGVGGSAGSEANQGLFFVPPLSCENKGKVDEIPNIQNIGNTVFTGGITVVTNKNSTVTINNQPISNFNTIGPFDVDGNTGYVTYKVTGLNDNISIESSGELYCAYFNFNGAATSGSFYSGFPSAPEINFNANISTLGNCIPNLTLTATNDSLFDDLEWFYDDGTGFVSTGNTTNQLTPNLPGNYKLIGTISCTGTTFESIEVPVSICPDDFDEDGIIDNLDVDFDNDGILDTDESLGNVTFDFNNVTNPTLTFADNSANSSLNNATLTLTNNTGQTNTFTGQNNGNFTSITKTGTASSNIYELDFNENVNILFQQNNAITHNSVDGESFVIKIGPNNKNITLIDVDDVLLVDTNFDGIFESNVTSFSASEIRFKYNTNPSGNTPFQFLASEINFVSLEHKLNNSTNESSFSGNFELQNFTLDSDNDGFANRSDLDSDNDGIPDIIEAKGTLISLSNTDSNNDGLDDVFTNPTLILDSDSDGVFDYLDLDSDNDGIFDLFEAQHNQTDANFDGILDSTNYGKNGFIDALETSPDNGEVNYTIADTDAIAPFNYLSLDADNDNCNDVTEAGFTDQNNDGLLGDNPIQVNEKGLVLNAVDGYTIPNNNYIVSAPIIINTQPQNVAFCEEETATITIDSNADAFQWEESTDGVNWTTLTNNAVYTNTTSQSLQISDLQLSFNNNQYRVILSRIGNSCSETSNAMTLTVNRKPVVTSLVELKQCDTDADKITTINLTEAEISLSTNPSFIFEYFETESDALAGFPEVADETSYPVNGNIPQSAWVRTISQSGCFTISRIDLFVSFTPNEPYEETFAACDDNLDEDGNNTASNSDTDGITAFNFSIAPSQISSDPDIEIEFYETEDDRTKSINKIRDTQNISNYRNKNIPNTTGNRFPIFYKLISKTNNDCSGIGQIFLRVDNIPTANPVLDLELCDNNNDGNSTNGIVQSFDLESQTNDILGTQNPADFTVTYYVSAADANVGNNPLASPYTNVTRDLQPIFVRVTNNTTSCFTDHTTFNLVVNPLPIANFVPDLEVCDDNADGSARNGFSQSIDLESQTATILGTQNSTSFDVTYHISLADAQAGNNPLGSPYSNSTPNRETIFVRVFDKSTQCANGISNFDVIVNPEPTFEVISNLSDCDDDADGDDTNGIIQSIDLDSKITEILGASQDPDDFNVTFHNSQTDATSGANPLASPYTNLTSTETIFVRIQNKRTMCVNDDARFDIIINPLPDFTVTTPQIVCLNILPLNIFVENPADVYTYVWTNPNGDIISNIEDVDVSTGGLYSITATTTDGTNCSRTRTIQVNESIIATLTLDDITVIDDSDNNSISIDNTNQNLGIGDYEYALEDSNGNIIRNYQDDTIFENLDGEIYTVLVRDKNGCGVARVQIPVVEYPKFFTPNGDGSNDTWTIKGANITFFPDSEINVFNRFGKLVGKIPLDSRGWDGTYNGKILPSDDYWFSIKLIDTQGNLRERTGNFSLLRK